MKAANRNRQWMSVIVLDSKNQIPISSYVNGASTMWTKLNGEQEVNISHRRKFSEMKKKFENNEEPQNSIYSTINVTDGDDISEFGFESWEKWSESMNADFSS
jgi:uncharacterized protein YaaN involved in tellurite resistance